MNSSLPKNDAFRITGKAENAKMGAIVITKNGDYYIDGITSWDANTLHKTVTLDGECYSIETKPEDLQNDKGEYSQGAVGKQNHLKNVKIVSLKQ